MDTTTLRRNLERAAQVLEDCDALLVTAGAGAGVDSGLPDFRGDEGFWKAYPPIAKLGISFYEMANPHWFHRNPRLAWGFYGHRLNLYRKTVPHDGFLKLLESGKRKKGEYFVFTSNVDGQFQKAGYEEDRIEECHGSIHHFQCAEPCGDDIWDARDTTVAVDESVFEARDPLPRCGRCGRVARPNVLMFGDWLWNPRRTETQGQRFAGWLQTLRSQNLSLAIVEMGAGRSVPTVRSTSEYLARLLDAALIRINPRDHQVPEGQLSIPLGAAEGIDRILEAKKEA
ncbi:MAG: NAD-dependent deacetylase [Candidatus Eiseniibacteriota bacterium]|nr:MAG: NAD-dependent deacetylase [Candidatus Eisenbacteria bacterium]